METQALLSKLSEVECRLNDHCYHSDQKFDDIYSRMLHLEYVNTVLIGCIRSIESSMPRVMELLQEESMPIDLSALNQLL